MCAGRIASTLLGASVSLLAAGAWAQEAFVTELRVPARALAREAFAWRGADGEISVAREVLAGLGIMAPAGARVRLSDVPGLRFTFDAAQAAIIISCTSACYPGQRVGAPAPAPAPDRRAWGGYINYDFSAEAIEGRGGALAGAAHAAVFGPAGLFESGWFADEAGAVRLDTRWTWDWPRARVRLRVGDSLAAAPGGGLARFGGVQIGRDFALAPGAITHPVLALAGEAETASTLELYIDGVLRAREHAEAGPFVLDQAPYVSGAGEARLVVTDQLGRTQIIERPFLISPDLLRAGLSDWSLAIGAERRGYGRGGDEYGDDLAMARYRFGAADWLTLEAGAASGGAAEAGATLAGIGFGRLRVAHAFSDDGGANEAAWLYDARRWAMSLQWADRDADFEAPGAFGGARRAAAATLNVDLGYGAAAFTAASIEHGARAPLRSYVLSYAPDLAFGAASVRLSYTEHAESELALALSYSMRLQGDVSAAAALDAGQSRNVVRASAQRAAPARGGIGWRVRAAASDDSRAERAELEILYRGALGETGARAATNAAGAGVRLDHSGAIGWIAGRSFAGRRIEGAFALVDAGAPGVMVLRDRLPLGETGPDGRLLATGLRAYDDNRISIDANDLPFDRAPAVTEQRAVPAAGAGLVVRFADADARIRETHVRYADGLEPARGAVLVRVRDGARFPVGSDGRVVLRGAVAGDLVVLDGQARCTATADPGAAQAGLTLMCAGGA